ncbi:MAG TPA: hypothetical protein VFZ65_01030 [Planctomycetota bacterium]|nr:hypothetical protein [Planctomycetota bacterium]
MPNQPCIVLSVAASCAAQVLAQVPQTLVVPAAYSTQDAVSSLWIAGGSAEVRQQTLVGASHLGALVGRSLTALELRRSAADETYQGGEAHLAVTVSTSPNAPLACSQAFAGNVGNDAVQVFDGTVTIPTSPPAVGPSVGWTPDNTVRIAFQSPFVYLGGTLCIDVIGQPVAGQAAGWWVADAEFEDLEGTVVEVGDGCGSYGGPHHRWSYVAERSLLPGAFARFWAHGTPNSLGLAAFGCASPPIPLTALGLPSPGCNLFLGSLDALLPAVFEPEVHPLLAGVATAEVRVKIPNDVAVFGTTFTTQWLEWAQLATSNAIQWTVAGSIPTLDMAVIEGHPAEATGEVAVHMAHVLRFEAQ